MRGRMRVGLEPELGAAAPAAPAQSLLASAASGGRHEWAARVESGARVGSGCECGCMRLRERVGLRALGRASVGHCEGVGRSRAAPAIVVPWAGARGVSDRREARGGEAGIVLRCEGRRLGAAAREACEWERVWHDACACCVRQRGRAGACECVRECVRGRGRGLSGVQGARGQS